MVGGANFTNFGTASTTEKEPQNSCPLSAVCLPISPLSAFYFLENRDLFDLNMTDEGSNLLVDTYPLHGGDLRQ